jgi:Skp family chaperone for outer membrane proteins
MKRLSLALAAFLVLCVAAGAQTQDVTKIGLCDFTKVLLTAYKDTKAYRDYDQARQDINKEIARLTNELNDLQNQKLDADKANNAAKSLSLQKTISDKTEYLSTYRTVKSAWLAQQGNSLLTGPVLAEILDVVNQVAEANGFALIIRSDTDAARAMVLYRIPEVDITDDVVNMILQRQGKSAG